MNKNDISALRQEYASHILTETEINPDPFTQFNIWFKEATEAKEPEPNAMALATAEISGKPSNRMVLLKGIEEGGFCFFTNYLSKKGEHLSENPFAALLFWWYTLERQIRIEGKVELLDPLKSDNYFKSRPIGSQVGAIASPQSQIIENRADMEARFASEWEKYQETSIVQRPDYWGGYVLIPDLFEFWQGRPNRLHDRIQFKLNEHGEWEMNRLAS
ncbi:MAG: pyridoxamine 5'-phosphate oxidase [Saprospiraceae bacterium]|nr:pyridoxamine 5'-phosphate oxidase [Saprospiraceae bacterium]